MRNFIQCQVYSVEIGLANQGSWTEFFQAQGQAHVFVIRPRPGPLKA